MSYHDGLIFTPGAALFVVLVVLVIREKEREAGDGWINIGPVDPDPTL